MKRCRKKTAKTKSSTQPNTQVSAEPIKESQGDYLYTHTHTHARFYTLYIWLRLIRGIFLPSGNQAQAKHGGRRCEMRGGHDAGKQGREKGGKGAARGGVTAES